MKPFVADVMLSRIGRILELEDLHRSLADRLEQKTREVSYMKDKFNQDALTGLWNRLYTEEKVNEILEGGAKGALLMIDMDNFKSVNDTYGHIAGDKVLKMLADTLRECSSEKDILCRLGGDEFVVFIQGIDSKTRLSNYAESIISDVCAKMKECEFKANTSVSIGIAMGPEDGTGFLNLYYAADKALYHVKQNGKNSYHFFSDKLWDEIIRGGKPVDLKYLLDLISHEDGDTGAYLLDFENFGYVYNFIRRFIGRNSRDVQTLLFTVNENGQVDTEEIEFALEMLEKAVHDSLRSSDVSARYLNKQLIAILMDANDENGDLVAERIIERFHELYTEERIHIEYSITRMDGRRGKDFRG